MHHTLCISFQLFQKAKRSLRTERPKAKEIVLDCPLCGKPLKTLTVCDDQFTLQYIYILCVHMNYEGNANFELIKWLHRSLLVVFYSSVEIQQ